MNETRKIAFPNGPINWPVENFWKWNDVRLMTHDTLSCLRGAYRVSEETTGFGIPDSFGGTVAEAEAAAIASLEKHGSKVAAEIARHPVLNP